MAILYSGSGHDQQANGELGAGWSAEDEANRLGYMGNNAIGATYDKGANPDWDPQGGGEAVIGGMKQGGTSAYDADVDRARRMGYEGIGRAAPRLDQTNADQVRGIQMGSLGLLGRQADGSAASAAAIQSQRANQGAAQAIGGAGMHGGVGAALSAQNAASSGAGNQALAANAHNAAQRAAEISHGQASLAAGAVGTQQQDTGAATSNAQLEAQQQALDEARQQMYERQAYGVRKTQQQAADDWAAQQAGAQNDVARQRQIQAAMEDQKTMSAVNMGLAAGTGGISALSDPRSKMNIGSLGHLMRGKR